MSITAVEAVAECRNTTPLELERPLIEVIDPDALDNLFDGSHRRADADGLYLTVFGFCECEVTVYDNGRVVARRTDDGLRATMSNDAKPTLRR
ncbi:hypothetical protein AUR64_06065 [Haloprofundus marisrubri]|uniref:Halobacterial output domain-containing protein n=1 Tax=Haloprofundus marisrubri TaxID=1514971 RepID=A0A0W1RBI5_9EURY|nr:HalOD1 output domain-containing protein [Haloprofundus marisrubri]KTG10753.1 hypothetical protein AUR64_06065 [Haloprofundus marisrubri]